MFLYCPSCQALLDKSHDDKSEGSLIEIDCRRCYKRVQFYIKYKPVGKVVGSVFDKEIKSQVN
mgnify:CR=1 FL=1